MKRVVKRGPDRKPDRKPPRAGTQSIERAVQVLKFLAADLASGVRVSDLAKYLNLEPATAHRILKALTVTHLAEQDAETRRYSLGPLIYELGLVARPRHDFAAICEPSVRRLAQSTGDVAMLTVRSGLDTLCMDRQVGTSPIRTLTGEIGVRRPLGVGAGSLAILSALPPALTQQIVALNKSRYRQFNGLTTEVLSALIDQARAVGYAHTRGEVFSDVGGVGMVIRDAAKNPIAALNVATTVGRLPPERVARIAKDLRAEVMKIEAVLADS